MSELVVINYNVGKIPGATTPCISVMIEPNIIAPIAYLRRPKWLSDRQWQNVLDSIRIKAHQDLLLERTK